jgi:MFS family permease
VGNVQARTRDAVSSRGLGRSHPRDGSTARTGMSQFAPQAPGEGSLRYAGWGVLAAAFTGVMCSFAPIVPYTFSLFLDPLHAAFGWKREAMGGDVCSRRDHCCSGFAGYRHPAHRFPPRRIILPSILIFAVALGSLSRLGPRIGQFYLTFFVLGLVANGTAQFAYTRTVLTWFHRRRGLALALLLTGSGVGSILIPPVTQWTIQHHGWRDGYLLLGGIALLGFPLTAMLVRNRPETILIRADDRSAGMTVSSALRTAAFWILACITILSAFSENGLVTNLAAILTQRGLTTQTAALALSVRGGSGIIGRLFVGILIDRLSPQRIQTFVLILSAAGTLVLALRRLTRYGSYWRRDPWRWPGQRGGCGIVPARPLLRTPPFLGTVRLNVDRLCDRRRNRTSLDRTFVRPRRLLSTAIHCVSGVCRARRGGVEPVAET